MTKDELKAAIRQAYFQCDFKDPDGIYPSEDVDLVEFADKLLKVIAAHPDGLQAISEGSSETPQAPRHQPPSEQ